MDVLPTRRFADRCFADTVRPNTDVMFGHAVVKISHHPSANLAYRAIAHGNFYLGNTWDSFWFCGV